MKLVAERGWDKERAKKYVMKLYEKHYLKWSDSCTYTAKGSTGGQSTPAKATFP